MTEKNEKNEVQVFVDPLEALLSVDGNRKPTTEVPIARPNGPAFKVTVSGMGQKEYDALVEECSTYEFNKKAGRRVRNLDSRQLQRLLVLRYTINPKLNDPQVQAKLKAKFGIHEQAPPEAVVPEVFLPGEIDKIADAVMECSGFTDDLVAEAKNS